MRRPLLAAIVIVCLATPAALLLARRQTSARVLEKHETIVVNEQNAEWHHEYTLRVTSPDSSVTATRDTITVAVARRQYDATRFGAHISLGYIAFAPGISWLRDSVSVGAKLSAMIDARRHAAHAPIPVSPLDAQTAGLARVVRITRVQLERSSKNQQRAVHLVEVEFWAQRARNLVRTIDVIDAGSIPGLAPRDIVEMHYDQREPRTLRLDDGRRTFDAGRIAGN